MAERVCPWWMGRLLASPVRRLMQDPDAILKPWVKPGMTVIEPGSGMGYFSLPIARMVGPDGRVVCVDLQEKMLAGLLRRAERAGLSGRIEARHCRPDSLEIDDLTRAADFALAFAVIHEVPDPRAFFEELAQALKPGATVLVSEPDGHVTAPAFASTLAVARRSGFVETAAPEIRGSHARVMKRAA